MRKENIITHEKIEVGIAKSAMNEISMESLEKTYPELVFLPYDESEEPKRTNFFIGQEPSERHPFALPLEMVKDPIAFWDYKRRILAYTWFRSIPLTNPKDLYEAWYILKFVCQEIQNTEARKLGKEMAGLQPDVGSEELEKYREAILLILQQPSTSSRIRNSLWKNYSNQLKKTKNPLKEIKTTEDPTGNETLLKELKILEEEALTTRLFFGTSPILYQD
ncbi:MAG TPA: hypothetical protein VLM88_01680 [Proteiniclasticum sp.]|nr:hypothetical protein [Proteiniclasticum sp.]